MADDEFDIDIYGDANPSTESKDYKKEENLTLNIEVDVSRKNSLVSNNPKQEGEPELEYAYKNDSSNGPETRSENQKIKTTDDSGPSAPSIPKQAPQEQGIKRKEGTDDRPIDPGATTALLISELNWWNTDDDIRGWINQAQVEDELKDVTFSEHKVNGKSKGQAWVEFASLQAATAAKRKIVAFGEGQQYVKKHVVTFSNPGLNPFRTLPKDAPLRAGKDGQSNRAQGGNYNNDRGNTGGHYGGNFRGRTPSYNTRGGMNNNMNNFNRNFSGPAMGTMGNMGTGFNGPMAGYSGNPMGNQFGNFNNRGGMMGNMRGGAGMRGGRGGIGNGMIGGMPMGGMQMGGIPSMAGMPMNMGNMAGGLPGSGFQGMQPHFNPAFFQGNPAVGTEWQNPHGTKRPRPE
ncbi:hypothetical protein K3495_g1190 [Podosphaera aphanis]|nr:hypothetical protein K3495_g1190 [Podosphaera aphanis]